MDCAYNQLSTGCRLPDHAGTAVMIRGRIGGREESYERG